MEETMEQYMSKTRTDYGSGVARPKIEDKDNFELKGQFLMELRTNTFNGSDHEDANGHIEKVLEIVDLFHIPNITIDQVMLKAFPMSLTGAASHRGNQTTFSRKPDENLYSGIERFKELLDEVSLNTIQGDAGRKEKDPGSFTLPCFINNVCFDNALVDLGASVSVMPLSTYLNLGLGELAHTKLTVELADRTVKYTRGIAENVLVGIGKFVFPLDFIILDMLEDIKVPLILERPFLSTAPAKIDVYKRKDYIELNDLNEPFGLKRNQGDDLMPTIEEGGVIEKFRSRDDELDVGIDDYPSYCNYDKKIHIDCAHNLKFLCMIGFEFTHANFFPLLYDNVMSKKFHNSIMKDKMVYKGNNVLGALMNVPIFVATFSVVTDFAVFKNMNAYRNEGMGDVVFGKPFLREVGIKTRRFEGMITIYNGDDEVTYQIVRLHLRFKHHTDEQCNKIPPLLKVSEEDKIR
ncbi:homeodomain-like protein [Tanacetum coccineum]